MTEFSFLADLVLGTVLNESLNHPLYLYKNIHLACVCCSVMHIYFCCGFFSSISTAGAKIDMSWQYCDKVILVYWTVTLKQYYIHNCAVSLNINTAVITCYIQNNSALAHAVRLFIVEYSPHHRQETAKEEGIAAHFIVNLSGDSLMARRAFHFGRGHSDIVQVCYSFWECKTRSFCFVLFIICKPFLWES